MLGKLVIVFLFIFFFHDHVFASSTKKVEILLRVEAITSATLKLSMKNGNLGKENNNRSNFSEIQAKIGQLLEKEKDSEVLARTALISFILLSPGKAEEQDVDNVFDELWRQCVFRIGELGGEPSEDALNFIEQFGNLDGGFSLILNSAKEKVAAKKKPR